MNDLSPMCLAKLVCLKNEVRTRMSPLCLLCVCVSVCCLCVCVCRRLAFITH
jgi:hypothetical protein